VSFASDEKPANVKARAMLRMVDQINKTSLPQLTRRHTLDVEAIHRDHGIVEQVIAELKSGPLAHLPSGGVHRERGLAGVRRDRPRPHSRRRRAGRWRPCPHPHPPGGDAD
jgi:hypothetical protein